MTQEELRKAYRLCVENEANATKACADGGIQFKQDGGEIFIEVDTVKERLQKMYLAYLAEEGYRAELDNCGDVCFKYEGRHYYIDADTDNNEDGLCFQVVFPAFWEIENNAERRRALAAANRINRSTKLGKLYLASDNTWARITILLQTPEQFKDYFRRALLALQCFAEEFRQEMCKDKDEDEDD